MTSLIVKPTGIHVTDGEVEILCADQEQAAKLLYNQYDPDNCTLSWCEGKSKVPGTDGCYNQCAKEIKKDHPYPIPGLRFTEVDAQVARILAPYGKHKLMPLRGRVAILNIESEEGLKKVPPEVYNFIKQVSLDGTVAVYAGESLEQVALRRFHNRVDQAKVLLKTITKKVAILSVEEETKESQEDDSMWKQEYDAAVREIMDLQAQLKEAESYIRDLEAQLRNP